MSMPVSGPPRRLPLSVLIVPMSCGLLLPLVVKAEPPWQLAQFFATKSVLPAVAAEVSEPSALRSGLDANVVRDLTYAASASRSR